MMLIRFRTRDGVVEELDASSSEGQREARAALIETLKRWPAPSRGVARHLARLSDRQLRPPRGRAVPGLRPDGRQAKTPGAFGVLAAHGDDCPCPGCYPNQALSIADRRLLWELIGERRANPTTRRSE